MGQDGTRNLFPVVTVVPKADALITLPESHENFG